MAQRKLLAVATIQKHFGLLIPGRFLPWHFAGHMREPGVMLCLTGVAPPAGTYAPVIFDMVVTNQAGIQRTMIVDHWTASALVREMRIEAWCRR
jgi:hypothetical protein